MLSLYVWGLLRPEYLLFILVGDPGQTLLQCRISWTRIIHSMYSVSLLPSGSMNSLPGRAALSLCRRTATGGMMRVLSGAPAAGVLSADRASFQAVRVCHSGTSRKPTVNTKKRGYDITRNPYLNKVSTRLFCITASPIQSEASSTSYNASCICLISGNDGIQWVFHCRLCLLLLWISHFYFRSM